MSSGSGSRLAILTTGEGGRFTGQFFSDAAAVAARLAEFRVLHGSPWHSRLGGPSPDKILVVTISPASLEGDQP